ncbi:uncharacterized protein LOC114751086 [Neltuma alba]|uniref:uncharacterized protein LOC114751086 n=1 Tax=Neltuma alba TaxID=207710 RepID=UPI0010A50AEE|nr:uncharacterized protein LOC114751086 [Prosopis alba]
MEKEKQKEEESPKELPSDVLYLIIEKFDIDDLFSFRKVCKHWKMTSDYWSDFMASDSPLIVQKTPNAERSCSFYSIPEARTFDTSLSCFNGFSFARFSSGYMIMVGDKPDLLLINPFARKRIEIPKQDDLFSVKNSSFKKAIVANSSSSSEEFIVVILNDHEFNESNMLVYQSRVRNPAIYSSRDNGDRFNVDDVVVFHKTIYAITRDAEIGVVMLEPQGLRFLNLMNNPENYGLLKLVNSNDDQLLVVNHLPYPRFEIYMIDFSARTWIKLRTLGDRSLFSVKCNPKCYALSNPARWGFRSNCFYRLSSCYPKCEVFSMDGQFIETISIPEYPVPTNTTSQLLNYDWCFRPRRDVVDYGNLIESLSH